MLNPFVYGNPVNPAQFCNRRWELNRITSRIINHGQSTAVIGEPRSGKTSLLLYLASAETRAALYGDRGKQLLFSYLDAQTLGSKFSQANFWEHALHPLCEQVIIAEPLSPMALAYATCRDNGFGAFVLERLMAHMEQSKWRLVLLLDEFDVLLYHPILNSAEFFGSLRSVTSRSRGALALVIACRYSLKKLNKDTQELSRTGSPYFNFLGETILEPLPDKHAGDLLHRAGKRFTQDDRRFIAEVAGGQPYLLQAAASALWDAYAGRESNPEVRRMHAGEDFYNQVVSTLGDIWRCWSPAKQKVLTAVSLGHINSLALGEHDFRLEYLNRTMSDSQSELRELQKQGFIVEDVATVDGWRVRPGVLLWWLADEIVRLARDDTPFEEWILAQEWQGQLTREERKQLRTMGHVLGGWFEKGATVLIEAAAKGLGAGIIGKE